MSEQSDGSLREGLLCISPVARKKNVQTLEECSSLNIYIRPESLFVQKMYFVHRQLRRPLCLKE